MHGSVNPNHNRNRQQREIGDRRLSSDLMGLKKMRLSTVSTNKCLLCGEGTHPKRQGREDPLLAAWDEETISTLVSVLFHAAEGKEAVENLLRTGGYCGPCRLLLRDLSLTHKIISNGRRQLAKVVETIVHNVSTHMGKVSQQKTKGKFEEEVLLLFKELQEEDWTLQSFEYIESAVLKSFLNENEYCGTGSRLELAGDEVDEDFQNFFVKEELEEFSNENDPLEREWEEADTSEIEDKLGVMDDLASLNNPSVKCVPVGENQSDGVLENNGDPGDCSESDFVPQDDSESSDSEAKADAKVESDDEYVPPSPKRRDTRVKNKSAMKTNVGNNDEESSEETSSKLSGKLSVLKPSSSSLRIQTSKPKLKFRLSEEQLQNRHNLLVACREVECNKRFRSEPLMEGHFNKFHLGDRKTPFRCTLCKNDSSADNELIKGFVSHTELQKHMRASHNTSLPGKKYKHKCPHCGKLMGSAKLIEAHVASKHEKKSLHGRCDVCQKRFDTVEEMESHRSKIHQGKYPFTCEDCNKIFADAVALRFHVKHLHSLEERLLCTICTNRSFASKERLEYHQRYNHPELRGVKYHCETCDISFKNYYYYRDHRMELHRETLKKPHIYKCDECNTNYKRINQLTAHRQRMHSGNREKKHKCSLCPKAFVSVCSLKNHEEGHSGLKHICFICGRPFSAPQHLNHHMKFYHPDGNNDSGPVRKMRKPREPKIPAPVQPHWVKVESASTSGNEALSTTQEANAAAPTKNEVLSDAPDPLVDSTVDFSVLD